MWTLLFPLEAAFSDAATSGGSFCLAVKRSLGDPTSGPWDLCCIRLSSNILRTQTRSEAHPRRGELGQEACGGVLKRHTHPQYRRVVRLTGPGRGAAVEIAVTSHSAKRPSRGRTTLDANEGAWGEVLLRITADAQKTDFDDTNKRRPTALSPVRRHDHKSLRVIRILVAK